MIIKTKKDTNIFIEESKRKRIENPDCLLKMDKIFFKDGSHGLITRANQDSIEIMITSRIIIKKNKIQSFIKKISHIVRAECFEI